MSVNDKLPQNIYVHASAESNPSKAESTRLAILNSMVDLIWSQPFRDLTVSAVMKSTGVGRSAFYQYFNDLHEVIEALLEASKEEIFTAAAPWVSGVGDPVVLVQEALSGLVRVCYQRGPILKAVVDAAATDKRLDDVWNQFMGQFDEAATARIKADQKQGLIPDFDARSVAFALNRLDAYTLIEAFGQRPRMEPEPVRESLARIWISTLYGAEWVEKESSDLVRT